MNNILHTYILTSAGASSIDSGTNVQSLWGGYGSIVRYRCQGGELPSVIVKHIRFPEMQCEPDIGHLRKLHSYQVETAWYQQYAQRCTDECRVAQCHGSGQYANELWLVLEDLDASGFGNRRRTVTPTEIKACLRWLANFHALWMNTEAPDLWPTGTYWHLSTRPDELAAMDDADLRSAAPAIDRILKQCPHQTLVHGDAKLDNFCFSKDGQNAAAVDFQYVGLGCGMKDVAYLIGCCFADDECERNEKWCLDYYFAQLTSALDRYQPYLNTKDIESSWRKMYHFAWTDFHRFYKGWAGGHWDKQSYSERIARSILDTIKTMHA